MKTTAYLVVALAVLCVAPIYAQSSAFTDVPSEHWAYDAVETLQAKGILQGYPDGTFQGKRTMSRYELATVIARLLQQITPVDTSNLATKDELEALRKSIPAAVTPTTVDLSGLATKEDLANLRKLVDSFKDELQSLGVDVDQIKRDLAALTARVDAIEAELRRVRFTGSLNVIAKAYSDNTPNSNFASTGAIIIDQDGKSGNPINGSIGHVGSAPLRDISVYEDFDLNLVGRVNENTTAMATINFGNYITYLNAGFGSSIRTSSSSGISSDMFTPYYMSIETDLGFGRLSVGRFPLQLGPYLFKMPDVDSYVEMAKTDSGNRPVDGAMIKTDMIGIDWTLFAAQHEKVPSYTGFGTAFYGVPFTQSAGVQIGFNAPANIRLAGTYYQGWDRFAYKTSSPDILEVMGADLNVPLPWLGGIGFNASWAKANQKVDGRKLDLDNQALDGRIAASIGSFGVGVGYRDIGMDFAAPGSWDKWGYIINPTNFKGFNADVNVNLGSRFKIMAGGEFAKIKRDGSFTSIMSSGLERNDKINHYYGGIDFMLGGSDTIGLDGEMVQVDAKDRPSGSDKPQLTYVSLNWIRQMGDNARLKVEYQFADFRTGFPCGTGNPAWKGGIGVVQLGVSF